MHKELRVIKEADLLLAYGPVMTTAEAAAALKYPSPNAMRMALRRGSLVLQQVVLPGRRGHYFATASVASAINAWLSASVRSDQGIGEAE